MRKTVFIGMVGFLALGLLSAATSLTGLIDVTSNGIPISINAPEGATLVGGPVDELEEDGVPTYICEVSKGDFSLAIMMKDDETHQKAEDYYRLEEERLEDLGIEGYVLKETNGFIYKYDFNGEIHYGCYYVLIKNNRAIQFTTGIYSDDSSLTNVKAIYTVAKSAK